MNPASMTIQMTEPNVIPSSRICREAGTRPNRSVLAQPSAVVRTLLANREPNAMSAARIATTGSISARACLRSCRSRTASWHCGGVAAVMRLRAADGVPSCAPDNPAGHTIGLRQSHEEATDAAESLVRQARTPVRAHQGLLRGPRRERRRGRGASGADRQQGTGRARRDQGRQEEPSRDRDRLRAVERGAHRPRPRVERARGGGGGLLVRPDLGPLPSLDRPPGPEPVRVERPRRHRRGDREARASGPASPARRSGSIRRSSPRPPRPPPR